MHEMMGAGTLKLNKSRSLAAAEWDGGSVVASRLRRELIEALRGLEEAKQMALVLAAAPVATNIGQ